MNSPMLQLLVLAGIAVFLILRLRNVLGTREGFEKPPMAPSARERGGPDLEVIEGGPDLDITDHAEEGSDSAKATEIPPFSPPHVMIGITPLVNPRKGLSINTGAATADRRANRANAIDRTPVTINDVSKAMTKTSNPIIRNRTAFKISSISFQK